MRLPASRAATARGARGRSACGRGSRRRRARDPSGGGASRRRTVSTSGSSGISRSSRAGAVVARRGRRRARRRRAPRRRRASARSRSRACTCASGSPAPTSSPGLACTTMPTAWSIGSSLRSRPAPSRIAARPIARAPQRTTAPRAAPVPRARRARPRAPPRAARRAADRRPAPRPAARARAAPHPRRSPPRPGGARPRVDAEVGEHGHARRRSEHELAEVGRAAAGQHLARLGDLERVADGGAERRVHGRELADRRAAGAHADVAHAHRELAAEARSGTNAPSPTLTSRRIASAPAASFFDITDAAISPGRRHGAGDVAQRVEHAVGGHEIVV